MPLPLTTRWPRILLPVSATQQIRQSVTIHVHRADALGMVRTQAMHQKSRLRNASRSIPANGILLTHHLRAANPARSHTNRHQDESCNFHFLDQFNPPGSNLPAYLFWLTGE